MIRALVLAGIIGFCSVASAGLTEQGSLTLDYAGRYEDMRFVVQDESRTDQFVFARLVYNGLVPYHIKNWYTDWPQSDRHLIMGVQRLTNLNIADRERVVPLNDPRLFEYPFLYTSEPGQMVLTDADAATLREYLRRGGFWVVDDFWGSLEWASFERQIQRILPGAEIKEIPRDHEILHCFYDIDEIVQVPSLNYAFTGVVVEQDGFEPFFRGIWDDGGRLMVVINHNTDLGDAYEHADDPLYPNEFSAFAYRMALNLIVYSLTH